MEIAAGGNEGNNSLDENTIITKGLPQSIEFQERKSSAVSGVSCSYGTSSISPLRIEPVNVHELALLKTIRDQANKNKKLSNSENTGESNYCKEICSKKNRRIDPPVRENKQSHQVINFYAQQLQQQQQQNNVENRKEESNTTMKMVANTPIIDENETSEMSTDSKNKLQQLKLKEHKEVDQEESPEVSISDDMQQQTRFRENTFSVFSAEEDNSVGVNIDEEATDHVNEDGTINEDMNTEELLLEIAKLEAEAEAKAKAAEDAIQMAKVALIDAMETEAEDGRGPEEERNLESAEEGRKEEKEDKEISENQEEQDRVDKAENILSEGLTDEGVEIVFSCNGYSSYKDFTDCCIARTRSIEKTIQNAMKQIVSFSYIKEEKIDERVESSISAPENDEEKRDGNNDSPTEDVDEATKELNESCEPNPENGIDRDVSKQEGESKVVPELSLMPEDVVPTPKRLLTDKSEVDEERPSSIVDNLVEPPAIIRHSSVPSPTPGVKIMKSKPDMLPVSTPLHVKKSKEVMDKEEAARLIMAKYSNKQPKVDSAPQQSIIVEEKKNTVDTEKIDAKERKGSVLNENTIDDDELDDIYLKIEKYRDKLMDVNSSMDEQTEAAQMMAKYAKLALKMKKSSQ